VWSVGLENEKVSLQKELSGVRGSLREVETSRADAHSHWQELRRTLTSVETERNLLTDQVNDLQVKLTTADHALEQLRQDNFALKHKVVVTSLLWSKCSVAHFTISSLSCSHLLIIHCGSKKRRLIYHIAVVSAHRAAEYCVVVLKSMAVESDLDTVQKEMSSLQRHLADTEDEHRLKELNLCAELEDARQTEYQLNDERRRLEGLLDEAGTKLMESKLRLSVSEGCVSALESQLSQVNLCRVETETKLAAVMSTLRRFVGVNDGEAVTRSKSLSPRRPRCRSALRSRSRSPLRGDCFHISVGDC